MHLVKVQTNLGGNAGQVNQNNPGQKSMNIAKLNKGPGLKSPGHHQQQPEVSSNSMPIPVMVDVAPQAEARVMLDIISGTYVGTCLCVLIFIFLYVYFCEKMPKKRRRKRIHVHARPQTDSKTEEQSKEPEAKKT